MFRTLRCTMIRRWVIVSKTYSQTRSPKFELDAKLILYADPTTKKLVRYDEPDLNLVPDLRRLKLHELVRQKWFQDNSLIFDKLLKNDNFVMCVYPPGSGKSTIAELLKFYLSKNGMAPEIRSWLDTCKFQNVEDIRAQGDSTYRKFRGSSSFVLLMDFSQIQGKTPADLETTYARYMLDCWRVSGLPENMASREEKLLEEDRTAVWNSLLRLRSDIHSHFSGNLYIILDSLDNMYNLIASLPYDDSKELYRDFTKCISKIVYKDDPRIKAFCFGVSPYLIQEFRTSVVYSIIDETNELGEYFSFSDSSIQNMINGLNVTVDQCKSVSEFQYNSNVYVNPYLCISYLRSLKENGAKFTIDLSPRSLWMKCIFEESDLELLYEVLSGKKNCKFGMAVSMYTMCTLPQASRDRKLYYPLFVFGGLFSCLKSEDEVSTYSLFSSNESSRKVLDYHLELLHLKKFLIPVSKSMSVFDEYLNGNFQSFCDEVSAYMMTLSPFLIREEKPYHSCMAAFTWPLKKLGYLTYNDQPFGLIRPDSVILKDRLMFIEYKNIIPPDYIPKKARLAVENLKKNSRCEQLGEFYKGLENVKKSIIVDLCKKTVAETRVEQIPDCATTLASHLKKNVEVNIMLFYMHHVILLHCTYYCETMLFSEYEIFTSRGYFDKNDLESIKNAK